MRKSSVHKICINAEARNETSSHGSSGVDETNTLMCYRGKSKITSVVW